MNLFLTVPCEGAYGMDSFFFWRKELPLSYQGPMYPKLQQRMYKILNCAAAREFHLHHLDVFKTNRTHYFIELISVDVPFKYDWGWGTATKRLPAPTCYYLGSFHNFWNTKNKALVLPHNLLTWDVFGMTTKPHSPKVWWWEIEHTDKKYWFDQWGTDVGADLIGQDKVLSTREGILIQCFNRTYDRPASQQDGTIPPKNYRDLIADALKGLGVGTQPKEFDPFKPFTPEQWEKNRQQYIQDNGYVIRIPQVSDIIHLIPNDLKTDQEKKTEKKMNLMRIIESPAPSFAKKYSSIMTWIDNIQDTTSILYTAVNLLGRVAPKAFGKVLPILGWLMLPLDMLDYLNAIGRAPFAGLQAKRATCDFLHHNPFGKNAQWERKERIRNFKPGWGDLLQALQTLDQLTGVGISLGAIMGCIMDSAFGLYKYLNGEKVRWSFDQPSMKDYERYAGKGLRYSALINSEGQTFTEEMHFWNFFCGSMSTLVAAPLIHSNTLIDAPEDPMNVVIPADTPYDPLTIEVIREAGLDVDAGVGWPFNDEKFITLNDLSDTIAVRSHSVFRDYMFRHTTDWYGYVAAVLWDHTIPIMIQAADPSGEETIDDTDEMKILYRLIKAPLLPVSLPYKEAGAEFFQWCLDHKELTGHLPGIQAIQEKWTAMGILFRTTYPDTPLEDFGKFWPEGFPGTDYT